VNVYLLPSLWLKPSVNKFYVYLLHGPFVCAKLYNIFISCSCCQYCHDRQWWW